MSDVAVDSLPESPLMPDATNGGLEEESDDDFQYEEVEVGR